MTKFLKLTSIPGGQSVSVDFDKVAFMEPDACFLDCSKLRASLNEEFEKRVAAQGLKYESFYKGRGQGIFLDPFGYSFEISYGGAETEIYFPLVPGTKLTFAEKEKVESRRLVQDGGFPPAANAHYVTEEFLRSVSIVVAETQEQIMDIEQGNGSAHPENFLNIIPAAEQKFKESILTAANDLIRKYQEEIRKYQEKKQNAPWYKRWMI